MMKFRLTHLFGTSALLAALAGLPASATGELPLVYEMSLGGGATRELRVQIDLRGLAEGEPLQVYSRAAHLNTPDQVYEISCDGAALHLDERGTAEVPEKCATLSWKSRLDVIGEDGILVEQQSFQNSDGAWGLVSGPGSLLRLAPIGPAPRYRVTGDDGEILSRGVLPPVTRPPFFLPFGTWATGSTRLSAFNIVYRLDDAAFLGGTAPWPEHLAGLNYFAELLQLAPGERTLEVVWLGRKDEENNINGAAGDQVLLVNYTRNGDRLAPRDRMRALFILLHEQFHQIDPGGEGGEAWYGESISTYYALKALRRQLGESELFEEIWTEFIGADRAVVHTFRDIARQMDSGDYSNSFLIYSQGAAFWFELDKLIMARSQGAESLDDYIGEIKHLRFESGEESVPEALQIFPERMADDIIPLIEKYVG